MKIDLKCTQYDIQRRPNELTVVDVTFVLPISPRNTVEIAEALKRIELYLADNINLVQASDKPRCYYCGRLNDPDNETCDSCSALL